MSLKKTILFFFALSLSACSTYNMIDIEILLSPFSPIDSTVQDVIIINYAQEQDSSIGHNTFKQELPIYSINSRKKKVSKDTIKVDNTTSTAVYTMHHQLKAAGLFESVGIAHKDPRSPTSLSTLVKIAQENPNVALLLLDSLTYRDNLTQFYHKNNDSTEIELKVSTRSQWLIYYTYSSIKPYHFSTNETLYWNKINSNRADCIKEALWSNTNLSAGKIIPHWRPVNRLYYTGKNAIYDKVDKAIEKTNWKEAGTLWMSLYTGEKKNTKKKGRMAFNMALFFEINNDLETAMMWLETAIDILTKKNAESELKMCALYVEAINNCLLNSEKLDRQYKH